jgi:hypothetical protein
MKIFNSKSTIVTVLLVIIRAAFFAQTEGVSIKPSPSPPHASAMLDVGSSSKGVLIPQVSLSSITDITTVPSPANSLLVFNTNPNTTNGFGAGYYYYSTALTKWIKINTGPELWTKISTTNHIQYSGGNVVIGNVATAPTYNFSILKPSDYYTYQFQGYQGQFRFGLFDQDWTSAGAANWLAQTSSLDPASNYYSMAFSQTHGNGFRGLTMITWIRGASTPNTNPGFVTIDANNNGMYLSSQSDIIFAAHGHNYQNYPLRYFDSGMNLQWMSDSTLKTNITEMSEVIGKVMSLHPVSYNWKSNTTAPKEDGLLAQEVESLFPTLVDELDIPTNPSNPSSERFIKKAVAYERFIIVLIKGMQEQQAVIQQLQNRVTALEQQ